jgi:hypothetical protein
VLDLRLDPLVQGLKTDPRFKALLVRLHLPSD